jgi:hypothetical protein
LEEYCIRNKIPNTKTDVDAVDVDDKLPLGGTVQYKEGQKPIYVDSIKGKVQQLKPNLPAGWLECLDPATNHPYLLCQHTVNQTSTLDRPSQPATRKEEEEEEVDEEG